MNKEVDLVYLWADGNDPDWLRQRSIVAGKPLDHTEENCKGRVANNDELKYSLRSVDKFIPWIRHIFIVTAQQQPEWLLLSHPKIHLINQKDIIPAEANPCFNSNVIEYFLYNIPDLAEYFLYSNDDMFFNDRLPQEFFFTPKGLPVVHLRRKPLGKGHYRIKDFLGKSLGQYRSNIKESKEIIAQKFGKYYAGESYHNIDAYKKSDYQTAVEQVFNENIQASLPHHMRALGDIHRSIFSYYALAIGHAEKRYISRATAPKIDLNKSNYANYFKGNNPKLFCMNDTEHVTDSDRERAKQFLDELFPVKSSFEK